jgi:hypothetical protein
MAKVKFFSYRAIAYLRITKIQSILAWIIVFALDKNHFTHAFFDFAKRGFSRQTGKVFPAFGSF